MRLLLPRSGYAPQQKSGPQEVGITAASYYDALGGLFLAGWSVLHALPPTPPAPRSQVGRQHARGSTGVRPGSHPPRRRNICERPPNMSVNAAGVLADPPQLVSGLLQTAGRSSWRRREIRSYWRPPRRADNQLIGSFLRSFVAVPRNFVGRRSLVDANREHGLVDSGHGPLSCLRR